MTEPFYHHYLEFFLNFIVITLGAITSSECITLYFVVHSSWFLLGFSIIANSTLFYGVNFSVKFQNFKENLELYLPKINEKDVKITSQDVEIAKILQNDEDSPIKACRLYVQGNTYGDIELKLIIALIYFDNRPSDAPGKADEPYLEYSYDDLSVIFDRSKASISAAIDAKETEAKGDYSRGETAEDGE